MKKRTLGLLSIFLMMGLWVWMEDRAGAPVGRQGEQAKDRIEAPSVTESREAADERQAGVAEVKADAGGEGEAPGPSL